VVASLVLVGVILLFARGGTERLGAATLGIRRTSFWSALGWSLAIAAGISGAEGLYALLIASLGAGAEGAGAPPAAPDAARLVLALLGVAVAVPIAEEIAFRGYLFPALTRWRGPWLAAVLTALLFAAAHALVYPLEILPMLTFFGFGACLLYWITGSLLPCVGLHALNNAIVLAVIGDLDGWAPLAILGAPLLAVALLLPFARTRAPERA
jgi:uncharacterized protein